MFSFKEKRDKMAKKAKSTKSIIQKVTSWQVVIAIQVIASIALIALMFRLNALPMKYLLILIALVALLCVGTFFLMKPSSKKGQGNIRNIIGKVVSLILSVVLLIGSLYVAKGNSVLDLISGANTQTTRMSLLVLKDSQYNDVSDLKNKTIEINNSVDEENMSKALEALKKDEASIQTNDVKDFDKMAEDLYSGKTPAILVNQAYYINFEANHENFANETKEIWHFDITEIVKDISKNVDVTEKLFTIYISGIDTSGPVSTVSRSDVNMLVTVNPKTKQILMTSIPRDYYVTLANKGKKDKLTHAGLAGVENSVKTLENFLGIDINYYARVNFTSLIKMVDALGGITVNSPVAFTTKIGKYEIKEGENKLNAKQALSFVRERKTFVDGDFARGRNQQRMISAIIKKVCSPAILTSFSAVLDTVSQSVETNFSSHEINALVQMQLSDMPSWDIQSYQISGVPNTLPCYSMGGISASVVQPSPASIKQATEYIDALMANQKIQTDAGDLNQ